MKSNILLLSFILIFQCGCGNDMPGSQRGDGMVAVGVSDVLSAGTDIAISRASSSIITDGAKMGVFRMAGSGYDAQDNVEFTYSSSTGKWANTSDPILVGIQATALCAYYPFNSATFNGTTASLKAQKYEPGKDLSYAINSETPVNNANPDATFAMKHAYARIKMSIRREANYQGNCNVADVNIKDTYGFGDQSLLDIKTGEYSELIRIGAGWRCYLNTGSIPPGATNTDYDVLVSPQPITDGLTIRINVDDINRDVAINPEYIGNELKAGSQYHIKLALTDIEVTLIGNVNVADWVTDTSSLSDGMWVVPPGPGINVSADEINLGGTGCTANDKAALSKLIWAEGNLKSTDNSKPYEWTTPTDYGYYYTWNSIYTGNTTREEPDPCTKLNGTNYGNRWRTPSKSEFEMLNRCTDKKQVANNGVQGMWFMNNTKGLFLPAGGYRGSSVGSGTTLPANAGKRGDYWTIDSASSTLGYFAHFENGQVSVSGTTIKDAMLVRCVKDKN